MTTSVWEQFKQAASEGPKPIPDGPYDVFVKSATVGTTKTNKGMIKVTYQVASGPHQGAPVWDNMTFSPESPGALGFFFRSLEGLGIGTAQLNTAPLDDPNDLDKVIIALTQIAQMIEGQFATIMVGHHMWNGSTKNEVKSVKPYAGGLAPASAPPVAAPVAPTAPVAPVAPVPAAPVQPAAVPDQPAVPF
jgi:hypothetical protein